MRRKDLTGQKFGKLTVIEKLPLYKRNRTYYRCLCECGNETILPSGSLGENGTKSCGCLVAELKRKDVSNQKFGKLLAIRPLYSDPKTQGMVWECKCDCGKTINLLISKLTSGNTKSCGCSKHIAHNLTDLTGNTYGKLNVVRYAYTKNNTRYWECLCECGETCYIRTHCLTSGHTRSCGCLNRVPTNLKHNMAHKARIYAVWKEMRSRCNNPKNNNYDKYGARGIKVCDEWNKDFMPFYQWSIANGYIEEILPNGKNKLTIDRINNDGNYEPSNCRWVTNQEQARNKRNNVVVLWNGEKKLLKELAENYNISYNLVYNRYYTLHWTIEKALTTKRR